MTTTVSVLAQTGFAAAVETTLYAATGRRAYIDKISAYSAAGGVLTLKIVPGSGTAGAGNVLASKTFAAGESYGFPELVGLVLGPGDFISEIAGAASTVVRRITGREIT